VSALRFTGVELEFYPDCGESVTLLSRFFPLTDVDSGWRHLPSAALR
jgi:hypothetical protein